MERVTQLTAALHHLKARIEAWLLPHSISRQPGLPTLM